MAKKLTNDEVDKIVKKIRSKYDDYIVQFYKPTRLKLKFEDRYIYAMKKNMNMAHFLHEEIVTIETWIAHEKQKQQDAVNKYVDNRGKKVTESIADRVLKRHQEQIAKYNKLIFHKDASEEIARLFGALIAFENKNWGNILDLLAILYPGSFSSVKNDIQNKIYDFCVPTMDGIPPRLVHYKNLLERRPINSVAIEKEEKILLVDIAHFLRQLLVELKKITHYTLEKSEESQKIVFITDEINALLNDFRLKDLSNFKK